MRLFDSDNGIKPEFIEQLKTYSARGRDPREFVVTVAYYALVKRDKYDIRGGDDAAEAKWFSIGELGSNNIVVFLTIQYYCLSLRHE